LLLCKELQKKTISSFGLALSPTLLLRGLQTAFVDDNTNLGLKNKKSDLEPGIIMK
jgi:hypothetical protein